MRAGAFRHRLTIEQPIATQDSLGDAVPTWTTFAEVYGSLQPMSGRERFLAAQTRAEASYRARIRYIEGVTPKMRIVYQGKNYYITYVADDNRMRELVLDLTEGLDP